MAGTQRTQVLALVRELRSHMLHGVAKKTKKNHCSRRGRGLERDGLCQWGGGSVGLGG